MLALLMLLVGGTPLFQMSDADLDAYLAKLHAEKPTFETRLADVLEQTLGTPYDSGPLGEGPGAKYDPDPIADFTRVDCVTFVEQSVALAASKSRRDAVDLLQRIRYKDGVIDYEARNHFMETDWFPNNPFCRDATEDLGVPTARVTRTISRKDFFKRVKAPELGQDTPDRKMTVVYVPSAQAAAAEAKLPSPSVICFMGKVDWLFTTHCGIFVRDADGKGRVYQASVPRKQVIKVDLVPYLKENERFLGFTAWELHEPAPRR
jgi:D-alanyl-D-alanine carboxypeptidase/D-alanyl-D-alanine-endopeptidase (penicillin-binding protein 4)